MITTDFTNADGLAYISDWAAFSATADVGMHVRVVLYHCHNRLKSIRIRSGRSMRGRSQCFSPVFRWYASFPNPTPPPIPVPPPTPIPPPTVGAVYDCTNQVPQNQERAVIARPYGFSVVLPCGP